MTHHDSSDLQRFVTAQDPVFEVALDELRSGRKSSHWMWFVFPQLRGLGRSSKAVFYGIGSLEEARAYLAHPVLGPRLERATRVVLQHDGSSLHTIFGSPDDMKFRSSMTLFSRANEADADPYSEALDRFCGGQPDPATLKLCEAGALR